MIRKTLSRRDFLKIAGLTLSATAVTGSSLGYLLATVIMTQGWTMGLGASVMGVNMALSGVPGSLGILVPFLFITTATLGMAFVRLNNVKI